MKLGFTSVMSKQKPSLRNGSQKLHSDPKKAWQVWSNVKVMLTVFFDCKAVIHNEFLPCGQTLNREYYLKVVMREAVRRKGLDLWRGKNGSSVLICGFFTKHELMLIPQLCADHTLHWWISFSSPS